MFINIFIAFLILNIMKQGGTETLNQNNLRTSIDLRVKISRKILCIEEIEQQEKLKENTVYFVVVLNRIFRILIDEIFPSRTFSKENFKQTRERSQRDNLLMELLMCTYFGNV